MIDNLYGRYYAAARGGLAVVGWTLTRTPTWMRRERRERGATWARTNNLLRRVGFIR